MKSGVIIIIRRADTALHLANAQGVGGKISEMIEKGRKEKRNGGEIRDR